MLGLGPHASFIVAAYAVAFVGIAALILSTVGDDLKQRRRLAELERQGIRRRSAVNAPEAENPAPRTRSRTAKVPATGRTRAKKVAKPATKRPRAKKTPG